VFTRDVDLFTSNPQLVIVAPPAQLYAPMYSVPVDLSKDGVATGTCLIDGYGSPLGKGSDGCEQVGTAERRGPISRPDKCEPHSAW
jgi:hypothetical protein